MLSDNWMVGQAGHAVEHNRIAHRINAACYVTIKTGTAIQEAINIVSAAGGGTVALLQGDYLLSNQINLPWRVNLVGVGYYATTLRSIAEMDAAIEVTDQNYTGFTLIKNLFIDGNGLARAGVEWNHTGHNDLDHVRIENCSDYGLYIHGGVWGCRSVRCLISRCGNGVYLVGNAQDQANLNTLEHCNIGSNVRAGIKLNGGTGTTIQRCDIEFNGTGGGEQFGVWQYGGGQGLNVINSHFERNGLDAARGINLSIGDDIAAAHAAPVVFGNYYFGGVLGGGDVIGECNYAVALANTKAALVQGNIAWGHQIDSLLIYGDLNIDQVIQANSF